MARTLLILALGIGLVALVGCKHWLVEKSASYVTMPSDSEHDTTSARKYYKAARRQIEKHLRGKKGDLVKAEEQLKDALAADVRFGPAHHSLGVLYYWQGKLYLAAWEFEYAARLMPDRFEPLNNLGLVYDAATKYQQATVYYQLARQKAPNEPQVISNLARSLLRSGQSVDEIRPILEDVVATDNRPEWNRWGRELLGINPQTEIATAPVPIEQLPPPVESRSFDLELPLIDPPGLDSPSPVFTSENFNPLPPVPETSIEFKAGLLR